MTDIQNRVQMELTRKRLLFVDDEHYTCASTITSSSLLMLICWWLCWQQSWPNHAFRGGIQCPTLGLGLSVRTALTLKAKKRKIKSPPNYWRKRVGVEPTIAIRDNDLRF
jgi:hypothetical protein